MSKKTIAEILKSRPAKIKRSADRKKMTIGAKKMPLKKQPKVTPEERLVTERRSVRTSLIRKSLIAYLKSQGHIRPLVHTIEELENGDEIILLFKEGQQPRYFLVGVKNANNGLYSRVPYNFDDVFQIDYFKYGRKSKRKNKRLTIEKIFKAGTLTEKGFDLLKEENIEEYKELKEIKDKVINDVENHEFPLECAVYN